MPGAPTAIDARSSESPGQVDGQNGREGVYDRSDVSREFADPDHFHAHARQTGGEQQRQKISFAG